MADRELHVKITGDASSLERETAKAEKATESFASKALTAVKGLVAFAAGSALAQFFKGAGEAAIAFENSTRKLESTAKLTGVELSRLQGIAEKGKKEFGLSATVANDFAVELAKMAAKAGDVGKATPLLSAFLDVGAARGLNASETLQAVQQAILGIDEGTDKLFGKNPSAIYAEFAAAIGTTAGKLSDQGKAYALTQAALNDGLVVQGAYAKSLESFGGQVSTIAIKWDEFKTKLGLAIVNTGAMDTVTGIIIETLTKLHHWVESNEGGIEGFVARVGDAIIGVRTWIATNGPFISSLLQSAGAIAALIGKVTGFFSGISSLTDRVGKAVGLQGKQIAKDAGDSGVKFAEAWVKAFQEQEAAAAAGGENTAKGQRGAQKGMQTDLTLHEAKMLGLVTEGAGKRVDAEKEFAEKVKAAHVQAMRDTETLLGKTRLALADHNKVTFAEWEAIRQRAEAARNTLGSLLPIPPDVAQSLQSAAFNARVFGDALYDGKGGGVADKSERAIDGALDLSRAMLDVASASGNISSEASGALNSVLNLVGAVSKLGVDPMGGVIGILGALANLIGGWGSSAAEKARKDATLKNTRALEELSKDFGDYTGSASGRTFQGVTDTLGGLFKDSPDGRFVGQAELSSALRQSGLTYGDAKKLAERYGIDVETDQLGWFKLFQVLKTRQFGAAGNFTDQLASLEDSFGVLGVEDADDQYKQFAQFASENIPALGKALKAADLTTAAGRDKVATALKALYRQSIEGKLPAEDYGKASAPQFRQIVSTLLGMIGKADGIGGNVQTMTPPAVNPVDGGALPPTPPPPRPITGGITNGLTVGDAFGVVTSGNTPPVRVSGAPDLAEGLASVVTVNGGLTIVNNWPDVLNSTEAAELASRRVAEILGARMLRQNGAMGLV